MTHLRFYSIADEIPILKNQLYAVWFIIVPDIYLDFNKNPALPRGGDARNSSRQKDRQRDGLVLLGTVATE
ncbi:hypothetical protein, partial [Bartonella sp. CL32QHWL-2]|uniref:hypothetical protein n=1 Tax=Bartonella sp. CL32QHWL-2 TaxID=3243525 RepID=UPI0035D05CFF